MKNWMNKWIQTMKVAWAHMMVYRVNFFLQVIGPTLVFFFIKYNLWSSIYGGDPERVIQGYNLRQMLGYHLWVLIVSLLGQGHTSMNLAEDIRMGRISTYLIYPFNFWEYHSAHFLAFQCIQLLITLFSMFVIYLSQLVLFPSFLGLMEGIVFSLWVGLFWYFVQFFIGLLGFWLEETWVLRVMFFIVTQFLSGAIIPLNLYPEWMVKILYWSPFPYLTFVPVRIFMGDTSLFFPGLLALFLWMLIMVGGLRLLWARGLRLYTAAGM